MKNATLWKVAVVYLFFWEVGWANFDVRYIFRKVSQQILQRPWSVTSGRYKSELWSPYKWPLKDMGLPGLRTLVLAHLIEVGDENSPDLFMNTNDFQTMIWYC